MVNFKNRLILASSSPRRRQILADAGFEVMFISNKVPEDYPPEMKASEVAKYLAEKKAGDHIIIPEGDILITADTIVKVDEEILGKPISYKEGFALLRKLSGRSHEVITGVCMKSVNHRVSFDDTTLVHFKELSDEEISFYLKNYFPYDKAGAYGIQEWLGMIGVTRLEGSYFNVVGLPVHKVYEALSQFI